MKNYFGKKNLPDTMSIREVASKFYVDNKFNYPSRIKNTAHVDFNDKNLNNVLVPKLNRYPAMSKHATAKYYVGQNINEPYSVGKKGI